MQQIPDSKLTPCFISDVQLMPVLQYKISVFPIHKVHKLRKASKPPGGPLFSQRWFND